MNADSYLQLEQAVRSLAQDLGLTVPFIELLDPAKYGGVYNVRAMAGTFSVQAQASSQMGAETKALTLLLQRLERSAPTCSSNMGQMDTPVPISTNSAEVENSVDKSVPFTSEDFGIGKDPTMRLTELQLARKQPLAQYRLIQESLHRSNWAYSIEASLDGFAAVGTGFTKKEAKRKASSGLLLKMGYQLSEKEQLDLATPQIQHQGSLGNQVVNQHQNPAPLAGKKKGKSRGVLIDIEPDFALEKDPSSRLSELQMLRRDKYADYRTVEEKCVDNRCMFTIEASLHEFTATGTGLTKKEAKRRASTALLIKMGFNVPEKDLPVENIPQTQQVTPQEEAVVLETSPSQQIAEDTPQNVHTAPENSESHSEETFIEWSDSFIKPGVARKAKPCLQNFTEEAREECPCETNQNNETEPEDNTCVSQGDIPAASEDGQKLVDVSGDLSAGLEIQSPEQTSPEEIHCLEDTECPEKDQSPLNWSENISETSTTSADVDCFQSPEEVPEGERVEMTPEASETHAPQDSTEDEGLDEVPIEEPPSVTEFAEAGEIFTDDSVETDPDTSADSEIGLKIQHQEETSPKEHPCPEDLCSEGLQSLDENQNATNPLNPKVPENIQEGGGLGEEIQTEELYMVPPAPESLTTTEILVIHFMVQKLLKNQSPEVKSYYVTLMELLKTAHLDHFKIPDGVYIKPKNAQKLGKAAARDLLQEYGGAAWKVLLTAVGTRSVEFQEDAMKHLNIRLKAFMNRPKSRLARFFYKWDKPYR